MKILSDIDLSSDNNGALMTPRVLIISSLGLIVGCAAPKPTSQPAQRAGVNDYVAAVAAARQGDPQSAIDALERAIQNNATLRMARITLGELLMETRQYDRAVPHLQAAVELDPYAVENHYNLGLTLQILERLQEASIAYMRGLQLNPDDFKSNLNLGLVFFALDDLESALYYAEHATEIDPGSAKAWSNLAVIRDARGEFPMGERAIRRALEIDGADTSVNLNLVGNLIAQRRGDEAVQAATRLVSLAPVPLHFKRLGDAYAIQGKWVESSVAYDEAIRLDARFIPALNGKAEMMLNRFASAGRIDEKLRRDALALIDKSLDLNPDQPHILKLAEANR
jgi:tetratricopeptide (TPR) repeat protein